MSRSGLSYKLTKMLHSVCNIRSGVSQIYQSTNKTFVRRSQWIRQTSAWIMVKMSTIVHRGANGLRTQHTRINENFKGIFTLANINARKTMRNFKTKEKLQVSQILNFESSIKFASDRRNFRRIISSKHNIININ